jgi:hypothetical protein
MDFNLKQTWLTEIERKGGVKITIQGTHTGSGSLLLRRRLLGIALDKVNDNREIHFHILVLVI